MGLHFKFCLRYETEPPTSLGVCESTRLPPSATRCLPRGAAFEWPRTLGEGGALTWFCLELRSGERLLFRRQGLWRRSPGLQGRAGRAALSSEAGPFRSPSAGEGAALKVKLGRLAPKSLWLWQGRDLSSDRVRVGPPALLSLRRRPCGSNVSPVPGGVAAGWRTELAVEGGVGNSRKRAYPVVTLLSADGGPPGSRKSAGRVPCAALWGSGSAALGTLLVEVA